MAGAALRAPEAFSRPLARGRQAEWNGSPFRAWLAAPLALLLLCSLLFFYRLGDRGLTSSHEARAAQNAESVLAEGDWALPQLADRQVELQKPPLYYWLVALAARARGGPVDGLAVRLPAALAAAACVLGLYSLCALRGRPLAGFLAAVTLATCWHFTWLARVGRIDMPLTLTVFLALAGFYLGQCRRREHFGKGAWAWFLLAYLAVGAGLLLKGPVAAVIPAAVVAAYLAVEALSGRGQGRPLRWCHEVGLWWGVPLALAVAAPWYALAAEQTRGDLLEVFFWYHNVERGLGGDGALEAHPWWFYGPRLAADLLPWSLLLPVAVWQTLRQGPRGEDPSARFGLVWLLATLLFLSCMSFKRPDYLLPAYPGAALFLGCVAERWWVARPAAARAALAWLAVVVVGCAACWAVAAEVHASEAESRERENFAGLARAGTTRPVIFFRVEDHDLAFRLGRPLETIMEWENLAAWSRRPDPVSVVMAEADAECRDLLLAGGRLEVVARLPGERPLLLLRTMPGQPAQVPVGDEPVRRP